MTDGAMVAYAELAVTTNYSFLRGASHARDLVEQAKTLGLTGLGIADHNTVAGVVRAHMAAKEMGLRLAVGARLVFADGTPDILAYPQDRPAWGRLTRLLSHGKRLAEKGECILSLADLLAHIEGLNLIVCPPHVIKADVLAPLLAQLRQAAPRSVWLAAAMLYRGADERAAAGRRDLHSRAFDSRSSRPPARSQRRTASQGTGRNGASVPRGAAGARGDAEVLRALSLLAR